MRKLLIDIKFCSNFLCRAVSISKYCRYGMLTCGKGLALRGSLASVKVPLYAYGLTGYCLFNLEGVGFSGRIALFERKAVVAKNCKGCLARSGISVAQNLGRNDKVTV